MGEYNIIKAGKKVDTRYDIGSEKGMNDFALERDSGKAELRGEIFESDHGGMTRGCLSFQNSISARRISVDKGKKV